MLLKSKRTGEHFSQELIHYKKKIVLGFGQGWATFI
jgi:hypothetical protein